MNSALVEEYFRGTLEYHKYTKGIGKYKSFDSILNDWVSTETFSENLFILHKDYKR